MSTHQRGDVEIIYSRNAGWCWRCHRCDINGFNLPDEASAQRASAAHRKPLRSDR